ncbi:hypothetical protein V1504DRAFT_41341 [Lipomyces starkeyi]
MINLDNVNDLPLSVEVSPETPAMLQSLVLFGPKRTSLNSENMASRLKGHKVYISGGDVADTDRCKDDIATSSTRTSELLSANDSNVPSRQRRSRELRISLLSEYGIIQSTGYNPGNNLFQNVPDTADSLDIFSSEFPSKVEAHFHSDCLELAALFTSQAEQEKRLTEQVKNIIRRLPRVVSPLRKKNDLYAWREIFRLYIDAEIFFSSLDPDRGGRSVEQAHERFTCFMDNIRQTNVIARLKSPESKAIFELFWGLNLTLLQSAECQELNQISAIKISKTSGEKAVLTTQEALPELCSACSEFCSHNSLRSTPTSVVKSVHSTMTKQLLSLIPQLDDYICPVCYLIAFKPVRLDCSHVFCIRCLVKLQRQRKDSCPLCRQPKVLITADGRNIDIGLYNQMLLYFPEETKAKQIANNKESTLEKFPHLKNQRKCVIL